MSAGRLVRALIWLIDKRIPVQLQQGKVESVDTNDNTCTVDPGDGRAKLAGVKLQAVEGNAMGLLLIPKVGSYVLYGKVDNLLTDNAVLKTYELEAIYLRGDSFKGLVKVDELVQELDGIKDDLNELKQAFASWTVAPSDGGAALKLATATWYGQTLQPTNAANLQNPNVKHG